MPFARGMNRTVAICLLLIFVAGFLSAADSVVVLKAENSSRKNSSPKASRTGNVLLPPNKSENIDDVDEAMPLMDALLNEEKKSFPVPATMPPPPCATKDVPGACTGGGEYCCCGEPSPFIRPFFVAASFAVLVKSPIVDLPTYVKSSNVFLLTPAACFEACNACFDASSAAFFACNVN